MDDAINLHPTEPSTRRFSFRPDWRKVKRICLILFALSIIAYIGLHVWVKMVIDRILANPPFASLETEIREFWDSDIQFPKEWEEAQNVSADMRKNWKDPNHPLGQVRLAAKRIIQSVYEAEQWIQRLNGSKEVLPQKDWDVIQTLLAPLEDKFHTGLDGIKILGQEIAKIPATEFMPAILNQSSNFLNIEYGLALKAFSLTHEGKFSEAIEIQTAFLPLYFHESVPRSEYGVISLSDWISTLSNRTANVWDEQSLQPCFEQLNRWEPYLFRMKKEHAPLYRFYGMLNQAKIPIHYGKNVKTKDYYRSLQDAQHSQKGAWNLLSSRFNEWFFGSDPENFFYSVWKNKFEILRPFLLTWTADDAIAIGFYYKEAMNDYYQEQILGNQYDELRLAIASKLYFLRNQKHPARMADLVPDYFPSEINDRLTGKPVAWTNEEKK